jgi:hypothetical protein
MALIPQNLSNRLKAVGRDIETEVVSSANQFRQSANIAVDGVVDSVSGSMQELQGATVNLANSLNGLTGPGIGQSIVGNIANGIGSSLVNGIKGGIGGFLGAAFGGGFGSVFGGAGKQPNPLEQFASYNYVFTLGCLSDFELNFPDLTYRRRDPGVVILRSGGGPTPGSATLYESAGKVEYFIDDVEIETIVAGNPNSRSTNATSLNFKVTEPYSMGLFLQALQVSAKRAGHPNYIEAPFLLSVEFKGYDDGNNYIHASNLRRMFPLKFVNIEFEVAEGGSVYTVQAIPYHEVALTDETQNTHTDLSFSGATVAEMLQTGAKSLTSVLNNREIAAERAGKVKKGNQYVIMFPTTNSSAQESTQFMMGQPEQADDTATTREFTDEEIRRYYISTTGDTDGPVPVDYRNEIANAAGITVKRSNFGENIREYAERSININEIGQSKIVNANTDGGTRPMQTPTNAENEDTKGEVNCCLVNLTGDIRQATFSSGKKIQTIIEEIIITSEFGRSIVSKTPDSNGMIPWFRIESQVFNADSTAEVVSTTGIPSRIFVYRVIPYLVHISKFQSPSQSSPGIQQLKNQAIKEYNYIYTGKNKDILDFDIKFDAAFFTSINGDMGQMGSDSKQSVTQETTATGPNVSPGVSPGNPQAGELGRAQSAVAGPNRRDGGIGFLSPESQIARSFNEALMNSPVDLIAVDLKILGDPYYICDSGMGNYNALQVPGILNITKDGTMNYQNGEVDIEINFRTPLDYGPTGYMDFPSGGTAPVGEFSGLYQVLFCKNVFSNGEFTQELQTIRRQRQNSSFTAPSQSSILNTDNAGTQIAPTPANPQVGANSEGDAGEAEARANVSRPASAPNPATSSTYDDAPLRALRTAESNRIASVQAARANGANVGF